MRGEERGEESRRPYDPLAIRRAISSATISRSEGGNSQDASRGAAPPAGSCWDSGPAAPGRAHGTSSTGSSSAGGGGGAGQPRGSAGCAAVWGRTLWSLLGWGVLIFPSRSLRRAADVAAPGLRNTGILGGSARPAPPGGLGRAAPHVVTDRTAERDGSGAAPHGTDGDAQRHAGSGRVGPCVRQCPRAPPSPRAELRPRDHRGPWEQRGGAARRVSTFNSGETEAASVCSPNQQPGPGGAPRNGRENGRGGAVRDLGGGGGR